MKKPDSHKKMVNEEESECSTCTPPFHTCKKFSNGLVNSKSTNTSKPRNISLTKNGFECDVCLKVIVIFHLRKTLLSCENEFWWLIGVFKETKSGSSSFNALWPWNLEQMPILRLRIKFYKLKFKEQLL